MSVCAMFVKSAMLMMMGVMHCDIEDALHVYVCHCKGFPFLQAMMFIRFSGFNLQFSVAIWSQGRGSTERCM